MTIHLPEDVESSLEAAVRLGRFASVDEALAEAWRCFQRRQQAQQAGPGTTAAIPDPVLGSMRDYADELDEVVADAMERRREETWRAIPGE